MLENVYKYYAEKADVIKWKDYNQNELFFEYIKHEHDELAENFFAGIVCRYWGYAGRTYLSCNRHIPFEYCHDCIIDAIRYVLDKRVWENPKSSLYGDPTGPDKAIHIAMKRQKSIMVTKFNAQRRRSNFNTLSIDEIHEEYSDASDGLLFGKDINNDDKLRIFISEYFQKDEYINGLILDSICYINDTYKPSSVVKHLKNLTKEDFDYYKDNYNVDELSYKKAIWEIKQMSNSFIEIKLKSLLYSLRKEGLFSD